MSEREDVLMSILIQMIAAVLLLFTAGGIAGEPDHHTPYTGSAEFERLKGLAGSWQGSATMEGKEQEIQVTYRVTSAGSAIVETHFPGSPQEMVSIYHDEGGRPGMTHYCALKNRPNLVMDSSDRGSIHLDFTASAGIDPAQDAHMHALTIRFIDEDTIEQEWVMYRDGEPVDSTTYRLQRTAQL
jgi:hypothetical protein